MYMKNITLLIASILLCSSLVKSQQYNSFVQDSIAFEKAYQQDNPKKAYKIFLQSNRDLQHTKTSSISFRILERFMFDFLNQHFYVLGKDRKLTLVPQKLNTLIIQEDLKYSYLSVDSNMVSLKQLIQILYMGKISEYEHSEKALKNYKYFIDSTIEQLYTISKKNPYKELNLKTQQFYDNLSLCIKPHKMTPVFFNRDKSNMLIKTDEKHPCNIDIRKLSQKSSYEMKRLAFLDKVFSYEGYAKGYYSSVDKYFAPIVHHLYYDENFKFCCLIFSYEGRIYLTVYPVEETNQDKYVSPFYPPDLGYYPLYKREKGGAINNCGCPNEKEYRQYHYHPIVYPFYDLPNKYKLK